MTVSIGKSSWTAAALQSTLALGLAVTAVQGQTFLPSPASDPAFLVQVEKPFLRHLPGLAFYSSIIESDVLFPLGAGKTLQIGIPLGIAGADELDGTSLYVGNPRVSLLFGSATDPSGFVGVTLPTASNVSGPDLAVILVALPWLSEFEKWADDAFSARGAWIPSWPLDGGGRLGLRLGGAAVAPTDLENLYVYARLAGWGRVPVRGIELRADVDASYLVTSDDGFGRQFTSYMALGAQLTDSPRQPMIFIRVPLDGDAREILDLSVGMALRF